MGSFSHLCIVFVCSCHKQRPPPPALLRRTVLTLASRGQSGHAAFLFCGLRRVRQKHREVHRTEMESGMKKGWMSQTFLDNIAEPVLDKESCWLHQLSCRVVCRLRVCHPLFVANRWWEKKKRRTHSTKKKKASEKQKHTAIPVLFQKIFRTLVVALTPLHSQLEHSPSPIQHLKAIF